jgi:hypothetical protein
MKRSRAAGCPRRVVGPSRQAVAPTASDVGWDGSWRQPQTPAVIRHHDDGRRKMGRRSRELWRPDVAEAAGIIWPYFTKVTSNGPSTVMKKVAPSSFVHAS